MKLAILMLCHKNAKQIKMFTNILRHNDVTVFIHLDKKSDINPDELKDSNVVVLPNYMRCDVKWAQISQVEATLNLMKFAINYEKFDFFWLCSGQDFLIKSIEDILKFLSNNKNKNFINFFESKNYKLHSKNNFDKRNDIVFFNWMIDRKLIIRVIKRLYISLTGGYKKTYKLFLRKNSLDKNFYFGSQWWCLNNSVVSWMIEYLDNEKIYHKYFAHCLCPDESYFHTLVMNSPFKDSCKNYLHYIDWSEGNSSPKTFCIFDKDQIINSNFFVARKFDIDYDEYIINELINNIERKKKYGKQKG